MRLRSVGVRRIDARDQGLDQPVQGLAAQPPPDEAGQALLDLVIAARDEQVHQHPELAAPGQDRRGEQRAQPPRRHQDEALGHRHQPALPDDERAAMARIRLDQPIAEAQPLAEVQAPRLVGDEGVRAALEREAVEPVRPDHAAGPVLALPVPSDRPVGATPGIARESGGRPPGRRARRRSRSLDPPSSRRTHVRPRLLAPS